MITGNFEKQKLARYAVNVLSDKSYIYNNLQEVCEWIEHRGRAFCDWDWNVEDKDSCDDLEDYAKNHKKAAFAIIQNYMETLKKSALYRKKIAPDCLEKNMQLLQQLFALSDDEKEYLSFCVRKESSRKFSRLISDLIENETPEDLSRIIHISEQKILSFKRSDSLITKWGFIRQSYLGGLEPSEFINSLYFQKFKSAQDMRSFLLGKPLEPTLEWEDFSHIEQAGTLEKILAQL